MAVHLSRRLVSHRLRGFAGHENSSGALAAALAAGVRQIEIDTRVTGDGELLVFHDARLDPMTLASGPVSRYRIDAAGAPRFRGGPAESVPTLAEFTKQFASAAPGDAELLIDVKDPGAERRHCEIIEEAGLDERVRVMSWWPEVLMAVHALRPRLRLVLSFVPLGRAPWWLQSVRLFGDGGLIRLLGRLRGRSRGARYMQDTFFRREPLADSLPSPHETVGRYPVCLTEGLPERSICEALVSSGGAVATWPRVIGRDLVEEARARGLEVIAFSLDDRSSVERMLHDAGPALVFTNNASLFAE